MSEEDLKQTIKGLLDIQDMQRKHIACLTGFIGTLLGALQTKAVLQPDEIETLVEILEQIAPRALERPMQTVLNTVRVTAEETPELMEADLGVPLEQRQVVHAVRSR